MNRPVLAWILFPGVIFVLAGALTAGWIERKVRARMEYRQGPPLLQTLYDWIKLAVKRPKGRRSFVGNLRTLVASAGLVGALVFSILVWQALFFPFSGFTGDFFAWLACFSAASLLPDLADPSGRGRSRIGPGTVNLRVSSSFPLFIAWGVPYLGAGASFRISDVIRSQSVYGPAAFSPEGALAFVVSFISLFAAIRPADADGFEAGMRIAGAAAEPHPGLRIAMADMSRLILLFTVPEAMILLFAGGAAASGLMVAGFLYALIFLVLTAVPNLGPSRTRGRLLRGHLGPLTLAALAAVALTLLHR
jgi:NADH-quinone oxidoreductase subunit H